MKKIKLSALGICVASLFAITSFASCENASQPKGNLDDVVAVDPSDTLFIQMLDQLPEHKRDEIIEIRKANMKLLPYLKLAGRSYYLDLSKEEAEELGVNEQMYENAKRDVEAVNEEIAILDKEGIPIELPDVKNIIKK